MSASCCVGTNIFSSGAGSVVVVNNQDVTPVVLQIDGAAASDYFGNLNAIITSIGIQAQSGYQFMHAVREFIYVYTFTERVGEITLNGLVFPSQNCGILGPQGNQTLTCIGPNFTGLERTLRWYECNRITTRASAITIAVGTDLSYSAFLVGMKADVADASSQIAQFTMRFNFIPNLTENDDWCSVLNTAANQETCLDAPPCNQE